MRSYCKKAMLNTFVCLVFSSVCMMIQLLALLVLDSLSVNKLWLYFNLLVERLKTVEALIFDALNRTYSAEPGSMGGIRTIRTTDITFEQRRNINRIITIISVAKFTVNTHLTLLGHYIQHLGLSKAYQHIIGTLF